MGRGNLSHSLPRGLRNLPPDRGCDLLPEIEGGHRGGKTGRLIRGFGGLQSGLRRNSFRSKHLAQGAGDAGSLPQLYVTPGVRFTLGHPTPRNTGRANRDSATRPPDKRQTLLGLCPPPSRGNSRRGGTIRY